ncbi:unnamed protein product [Polarella glacialis]|uniref:Uncharacterized protein n=1 Tax=Polarella glacialis TaxID=89957 RepID=A0A813GHJ1_POLGL|nr:unnamed protein product [Polarella glacialis]CAE8641849.1 unnamed protein product [Polarella glacialis]
MLRSRVAPTGRSLLRYHGWRCTSSKTSPPAAPDLTEQDLPDDDGNQALLALNRSLHAYATVSSWAGALSLLNGATAARVSPDSITFTSAINACKRGSQWRLSVRLLDIMVSCSVRADAVSMSAAMSVYQKGQLWPAALHLLYSNSSLVSGSLQTNTVILNSALGVCASGRQWEKALFLMRDTRVSRQEPDEISFNTAINACGRGEAWVASLQLLDEMQSGHGLPPGLTALQAALNACEAASASAAAVLKVLGRLVPAAAAPEQPGASPKALGERAAAVSRLEAMAASSAGNRRSALLLERQVAACIAGDVRQTFLRGSTSGHTLPEARGLSWGSLPIRQAATSGFFEVGPFCARLALPQSDSEEVKMGCLSSRAEPELWRAAARGALHIQLQELSAISSAAAASQLASWCSAELRLPGRQ